ncbi:cation acetate symporter [Streptacidiphilus sp. PB12-B1b]|uniref:sodium/solute symporter n=1 Tax=Streptacidiphilus sp. PB12-B1b TaxID=2705012 RepID=UPI0015FD814B|nr:cation acetate symporter [Streptacidiphilus sp. PB12-B1b]QMU77945.1 cation acetate symporter [Streptacidiphilus sp. PB12-B1b]
MTGAYGIAAVVLVVLATVLIGALGLRISRTTSDFYVASRSVRPRLNGAAISGEYLSAASFLGIAGLLMLHGAGMLWYPIGYTAGYVLLLLFVAAPLRRSGAYTLPDFAHLRLGTVLVRRIAAVFVVGIGWLYLMPQLQGAGLTLQTATGAPDWVGGVLVSVVVVANVAAGGMRSITFVQAFQYWLKLTAMLVPLVFLLLVWHSDGAPGVTDRPARLQRPAVVRIDQRIRVVSAAPVAVTATGGVDGREYHGTRLTLTRGDHTFDAGARIGFPAHAQVPTAVGAVAPSALQWSSPLVNGVGSHPLYDTYGLILATFLGAMGLPHVVVRFYTSPDGRAARRTTLVVLALLGAFYLLQPLYGLLARIYAPDLALTGDTDSAVLVLPERLVGGPAGLALGALLVGGACAAFLSTSSGLAVSLAGVLSQDVLPSVGVRSFRWATVPAVAVPMLLTLAGAHLPVAAVVGLAFAVAASSFFPLLVLGIWWRGLTPPGAVLGLLAGGGGALAAVSVTMIGWFPTGWPNALLAWPAVWSVPVGFVVMVVASLATADRIPGGTDEIMARLHLPGPDERGGAVRTEEAR